jgi:hypothetical protein
VCSTWLVCGVPVKWVIISRYTHLVLSYASLRSQGAGFVSLIPITNHRVPISFARLRSTSYHTSKSEVLLRSIILAQPPPNQSINPTPHSSIQDAPPNPPSHHLPHRRHSRIDPASTSTSAEQLHNRLHLFSTKRNLRHVHRPCDVRPMRRRHLHMQR